MASERRSDESGSMLSEVEALREFWVLRLDPLYTQRDEVRAARTHSGLVFSSVRFRSAGLGVL